MLKNEFLLILDRYECLNDDGFVLPGLHSELSKGEREALFFRKREVLFDSFDMVESSVYWLNDHIRPIKLINRESTSYELKHYIEQDIGYISNGVFISAALVCGFKGDLASKSGPNLHFNMSRKSWEKVRARLDLM